MPELDPWLMNPKVCEYLSTEEGKALRDYLNDKLPLKEAACKLARHYYLELSYDQLFQKVTDILSLIAIDLSDSCKQRKIVKFLVALRNLRNRMEKGFYSKHQMNLRKETNLGYVLSELNETIKQDAYCEFYHPKILLSYCTKTSTLGLLYKVLAPILGPASIKPESNIQFINLHAFIARLRSVNTCVIWVGDMYNAVMNDDRIRKNRFIFSVIISATAQHMIYSASHILEFQMEHPSYHEGFFGWQKWKVGFEEAQTLTLTARAKKDTKLAVAAMNEAELAWNQHHMLCGIDKANGIHS